MEVAVPADALVIVRINILGLADLHTAPQSEHQPPRERDPLQSFHTWMALAPPSGLPAVSLIQDGDWPEALGHVLQLNPCTSC